MNETPERLVSASSGISADRLAPRPRRAAVTATAIAKPDAERDARRRAPSAVPPDRGHRQGGQRAELGPEHHRADDGHRGVGDDADRGEQARDGQHDHERHRQPGALPGAREQLVPHDGVDALARRGLLGAVGGVGHDGVQGLEHDPAALRAAQPAQGLEHAVDRLAGDVGLHDVAGRVHHRAAQPHDVHRARLAGQDVEHRRRRGRAPSGHSARRRITASAHRAPRRCLPRSLDRPLLRLHRRRRLRLRPGRRVRVDARLLALQRGDRGRRGGQRVVAAAGLREGDDLADRVDPGEQGADAVPAERDPAVRRRAVGERVEQEAELLLLLLGRRGPSARTRAPARRARWIRMDPPPISLPLQTRS